jgi:hypothetical protein
VPERLDEVVDHAQLEHRPHDLRRGRRRHGDHLDGVARASQPAQQRDAVLPREPEVEEQQMRPQVDDQLPGLGGRPRDADDRKSGVAAHEPAVDARDRPIVLDDEHAPRLRQRAPPP